jgi:hypothetical protein
MTTANWPDTAPLTHGDVVILDYLAALWAESDDLPPDLRDELMATVTEYVARRRTAPGDPLSEPAEILGRLGPPESLVAAARRGHLPYHLRLPAPAPAPPTPAARTDPAGPVEYSALALLTAGALVVPVLAPTAGLLLASGSPHWTPAQKAVAWVLTTTSAAFAVMFVVLTAAGLPPGLGLVLAYMAAVAGPAVSSLVLAPALSRRT